MLRRFCVLILVTSLLVASWDSARAQTPEFEYFDQTGHNVQGDFLKFYKSAPNPILVFGYPITEEFISKDGKTVQYFQRARFEFNGAMPEGQRVQVTPLGTLTYTPSGSLNVYSPFACRIYSETGYAVCFAFLEFFDGNGGVAQFGLPISAFEYHDNMIVQYFEKSRLEWQPWRIEGQRVVVSELGRVYFDKLGEDPGYLPPAPRLDNFPSAILSLQVRAFVWKAVTLATDNQLIFVIVQDQRSQPVADANCAAIVHWPDGRNEATIVTTNSNGVGIVSLSFSNQPYSSLINVDVTCSYLENAGRTTISFRIWY